MKHSQFETAVIALVLFGVGTVGLAADKVDLGKREYDTNCAVCHGATGKGDGPFASMMNVRIPPLTALALYNPATLARARTLALAEYVYRLQEK
jgi:cytochrome c